MIVLDTNVVSELLREEPSAAVIDWVNRQIAGSMFITATTKAELLYGVGLLSPGRRRSMLEQGMTIVFNQHFQGRVLPFDGEAAEHYPRIVLKRRAAGRPILQPDAQIAAVAVARGASLATRNIRDFVEIGLKVINPWD